MGEEKALAAKAKQDAMKEAEVSKITDALLEQINDKPPTITDKIISVLPYLFPLLDSVQYGRFLLSGNDSNNNPLVVILALIFTLYRSVPFSGFIAFFALSTLSSNFSINRLIRFNMQQAIFLDIALFFPGILLAINQLIGSKIPASIAEFFSDSVFISLILVLAYCVTSSFLGIIPDKIPIISQTVSNRMPTADQMDITVLDPKELEELTKRNEKKKDNDKQDKK